MGRANGIEFIHGKINIGEMMSPPIIRKVKEHIDPQKTAIIDVPPGTSCPVVEAVRGSDFCLLVTEPTPFGLNDLILAVEVVNVLGIPCGVVINRDSGGDSRMEEYCQAEGVPLLLHIPLDNEIARLYSRGIPLVEGMPQWREHFIALFHDIQQLVPAEQPGRIK